MSSQPGDSSDASREVTSASSRSPATTSSISRTDRSWPIASGVIDCGKTTVSFSGSTGSVAGSSSCCSCGSRASKSLIPLPAPAAYGSCDPLDGDAVGARWRALLDDRHHDRQHPVLEPGLGALGVDVLGQAHLALERPVLDLDLLVGAPRQLRTLALPGDHEQPLAGDEPQRLRVDPG